jgi:3-phenylpropionate/cinnamic acid dioxygenase small subunit
VHHVFLCCLGLLANKCQYIAENDEQNHDDEYKRKQITWIIYKKKKEKKGKEKKTRRYEVK